MLVSVTLAGAALAVAAPEERVEIDGAALRLRDLAPLSGFSTAARSAAADRIIAALPVGRNRIVLTRRDLAALVRRAAPAAPLAASGPDAPVAIVRRAAARGGCVATSRPIAAGEAITSEDIAPADCEAVGPRAPLRYRSGEGIVAAAALPAGAPLGRLVPPAPPPVARGAALTLVSRIGPVTISRSVTALQDGQRGRRLFVRDPDGAVFAVLLETFEEERP